MKKNLNNGVLCFSATMSHTRRKTWQCYGLTKTKTFSVWFGVVEDVPIDPELGKLPQPNPTKNSLLFYFKNILNKHKSMIHAYVTCITIMKMTLLCVQKLWVRCQSAWTSIWAWTRETAAVVFYFIDKFQLLFC